MPIEIVIDGILSDMDGTVSSQASTLRPKLADKSLHVNKQLVDSTPAVEKTMTDFCLENKIDPEYFFQHSHVSSSRSPSQTKPSS